MTMQQIDVVSQMSDRLLSTSQGSLLGKHLQNPVPNEEFRSNPANAINTMQATKLALRPNDSQKFFLLLLPTSGINQHDKDMHAMCV
jgi:hypothetical protein